MKTLLIGAGAALTMMTAAGAWVVLGGEDSAPMTLRGPQLHIAVVAPVEPTPAAGEIMQVGHLRDEYEHDPALLQPPQPYDPWLQVAWIEPDTTYHSPDIEPAPDYAPPPPSEAIRLDASDRSFGFDAAAPDYAAERAARIARVEAFEAVRAAVDAAPATARMARDSVFY